MGHLFTKPTPVSQQPKGITPNLKLQETQPIPNKPLGDFEKRMLHLHNKARLENGLEPLVWDKALQQKAEDWNMFIAQQNDGKYICRNKRHPGVGLDGSEDEIGKFLPNNNGQNLYQSNSTKFENGQWVPFDSSSPEDAVRMWYDECKMWKIPKTGQQVPDRFLEVGHMTQLLWKDAKSVGCSQITCTDTNIISGKKVPSGGKVINCHYDKGNVGGQFQQQIPREIKCTTDGNKWIN